MGFGTDAEYSKAIPPQRPINIALYAICNSTQDHADKSDARASQVQRVGMARDWSLRQALGGWVAGLLASHIPADSPLSSSMIVVDLDEVVRSLAPVTSSSMTTGPTFMLSNCAVTITSADIRSSVILYF